jgi:hypothetical protein
MYAENGSLMELLKIRLARGTVLVTHVIKMGDRNAESKPQNVTGKHSRIRILIVSTNNGITWKN